MIPSDFNPIFKSHFADNLQAFLTSKRAVGYSYKSEAHILVRIDKYFLHREITVITEETILDWVTKRNGESNKTHSVRVGILKQFCLFFNRSGMVATVPQMPKVSIFSKSFTPYIFTKEQISNILSNADSIKMRSKNSNTKFVVPVILRLLYCCGLRINEATSLRIKNIDLKRGTVTIMHSKNDNCRIVPISNSLKQIVADYICKMHPFPNDDDIVFPTSKKEQYGHNVIYQVFRELLWQSGIPHGGRGNGPRLHDLRHTFAVHSLQKLIHEGKDTYLLLPIISTYLGHKNIYATEKYLRLTSEMYPDILEKVELAIGKLVPEVVDYEIY